MKISEVTEVDLDQWFSYHRPPPGQQVLLDRVRAACNVAAHCILASCPSGSDRHHALTRVREAMFWGCAAIACQDLAEWDRDVLRHKDAAAAQESFRLMAISSSEPEVQGPPLPDTPLTEAIKRRRLPDPRGPEYPGKEPA